MIVRLTGGVVPVKMGLTQALVRSVLLLLLILGIAARSQAQPLSPEELGERLYTQGIGTDGKPVAAIDISGQRVFAPQFHCVSCHRRSGYGSREGGVFIPPIAAPVLYQPLTPSRTRAFNSMYFQQQATAAEGRLYNGRTRPAYDRASLARLLRDGLDPVGVPIPAAMPKFDLTQRDVAALDAYLRTLSAKPDPGVDETSIHFALIVSDRTSPSTRKMLVDTSNAFATRYNSNIISERSRPGFSPYYRSDFVNFWRKWVIEVWELKGPENTWPEQLEAYYKAQPVFAVIGGAIGAAPWQGVSSFCDARRIPCLFPDTNLPASEASEGGYTIYSYGGLPLEARGLAAYLSRTPMAGRKVLQLAAPEPQGAIPANEFAVSAGSGVATRTETVPMNGWPAAISRAASELGKDDVLVLWPGNGGSEAIAALAATRLPQGLVVLPSATMDDAIRTLTILPLADRVRILHPRELPSVVNPHSYRVRAWLYARRVAVDPPEDQFQVYYGLSVLEKAVMEIQGDYSREYLIEEIEMIAESNLNPGVYPSLTLGPGQRIASRGTYVVKLDAKATGGIAPDGDWIVP